MKRRIAMLTVLILAAGQASADGRSQIAQTVDRELPRYVDDITSRDLSPGQVSTIYMILTSGKSEGEKRAQVRSAVGGRYSLFGLARIGISGRVN